MFSRSSLPSYRRHKQSGQAIVTLPDGFGGRRDVLLGKYGSATSRKEYDRVISEWIGNGRRLRVAVASSPSINELALAYWNHAKTIAPRDALLLSHNPMVHHNLGRKK
jgi:hypothetical protein